ncbi:fumarylacetoacetate hydrolase family protein [Novosphingobium sp.]|uniref:fumarylacetoacetate hydrolase family protein n=1 Tax=Novosphingobium sp. TaxID=1874826 RepID=UPI002FE3A0B8
MKLCRFGENRIGIERDGLIRDVTEIIDELPRVAYPYPLGDALIANLDRLRSKIETIAAKAPGVPIETLRLLSPVANPSKIMGTPVNYHEHVTEACEDPELRVVGQARPVYTDGLFLKANSSLVGAGEGIALRFPEKRTDHEGELALVIGKQGTDIPMERALDYVAGYALGLDMVVRDTQDRSLRKSIDTYSVLGPWLVTADEIGDPDALDLKLEVNGELRQSANTSMMISPIAEQISWVSRYYTLYPGDILMTGTPAGVSRVHDGDNIRLEIQSIGAMTVLVRQHQPQ